MRHAPWTKGFRPRAVLYIRRLRAITTAGIRHMASKANVAGSGTLVAEMFTLSTTPMLPTVSSKERSPAMNAHESKVASAGFQPFSVLNESRRSRSMDADGLLLNNRHPRVSEEA